MASIKDKIDIDNVSKYDKLSDGSYRITYKDGSDEVIKLVGSEASSLAVTLRHKLKKENADLSAKLEKQQNDAPPDNLSAQVKENVQLESTSTPLVGLDARNSNPSKEEYDKAMELSKRHPLDTPIDRIGQYVARNPEMQVFNCAPDEMHMRINMGYRPARWEDIENGDLLREAYNLLPGQTGSDGSLIRTNELILMIIPKVLANRFQQKFDETGRLNEEAIKAMPNSNIQIERSGRIAR